MGGDITEWSANKLFTAYVTTNETLISIVTVHNVNKLQNKEIST